MGAFSHYLESALINATLKNTAYTSPVTVYLARFTADPTDANTGTEVSGGSYARQSIAFGSITTNTNGSTVSNSAQVTFPTATAIWGTVTHYGIYDASTVGNLLYHDAWSVSRTVNNGDTAIVATAGLTLQLD